MKVSMVGANKYSHPFVKMTICLWLSSLLGFIDFYVPSMVVYLRVILLSLAVVYFFKIRILKTSKFGFLYSLFVAWSFFIAFRGTLVGNLPLLSNGTGFQYSLIEIFKHAYGSFSIFDFLLPCVILIDFNQVKLSRILKTLLMLSFLSTIIIVWGLYQFRVPIFFSPLIGGYTQYVFKGEQVMVRYFINVIYFGLNGIILFSYANRYLLKKYIVFPIAIVAYFLLNVWGGARGDSALAAGFVITFFYLSYSFKDSFAFGIKNNKLTVVLFFILVISGVVYLYNKTETFDFLLGRVFEGGEVGGEFASSTREGFTNDLINDFNERVWPWIIGKGVNGYYHLSDGGMREWMEWGYLWLVLKGGIIYLVLYVAVLLRSFYLGVFKSSNLFSRACGFICLWQVIALIPYGVPTISFNMFVVWICCGMMLHPEIRRCDNLYFRQCLK